MDSKQKMRVIVRRPDDSRDTYTNASDVHVLHGHLQVYWRAVSLSNAMCYRFYLPEEWTGFEVQEP